MNEVDLKFWIKNGYNVLFKGKHGVGKTSIVKQAFEAEGLKWKYYSASTMDPWVDFVGVPYKEGDHLELLRPKDLQNDEVEAMFFDEFNRAHKKVRNAVMELIQFKSINGQRFNNLKVIWAAINPDDDDDESYDVEPLDPAQLDRFQIHVDIPYKPSLTYLKSQYGDMANPAVEWWGKLPPDVKKKVSPRRLDYVLNVYQNKGDVRHVLPEKANVAQLIASLGYGTSKKILAELAKEDEDTIKEKLQDFNMLAHVMPTVIKSREHMVKFLPLINSERLVELISTDAKVLDFVCLEYDKQPQFKKIVDHMISANTSKKITGRLTRTLKKYNTSVATVLRTRNLVRMHNYDPVSFMSVAIDKNGLSNTYQKLSRLKFIADNFPKNLSEQDLLTLLKFVDGNMIKSFQVGTLQSNGVAIKIVNSCIASLRAKRHSGTDQQFLKTIQGIIPWTLSKVVRSGKLKNQFIFSL